MKERKQYGLKKNDDDFWRSGQYKSSFAAFQEIVRKEGAKSLFKGAGANVLRALAGAAGY